MLPRRGAANEEIPRGFKGTSNLSILNVMVHFFLDLMEQILILLFSKLGVPWAGEHQGNGRDFLRVALAYNKA